MKHTESRAATCFSPAYCDVCQSYYGESRSHTESRAATCFSAAYCDACQSYYGEPRSHDWGEWMYYDSKSDQRFCQYADCDKKEFASHHWGAWLKADETSHYHECQASDCSQREYADHTVKTPANCTDPAVCSVCSSSYGDTNPNNHKGPPASSITGFTKEEHTVTETCGACGAGLSQTSEGHNWGEWTFHFAGGHYRICLSSGCGMGETESHTGGNPDCTRWATCDVCHGTYNDKTKHEDLIQFDAQASTCTESGWNAYVMCPHCYYSTISRIPPLDHDRVQHDAQAATCTQVGWNAYETCKRENCTYSTYSEIPMLDHDLVQHEAKAPTCTAVGWNAYETCRNCSYSTYSEIPALNHAWDGVWKDSGNGKQHYQSCKNNSSHRESTPAICTAKAYCGDCKSYYGSTNPSNHALVNHAAQAPTCTEIGWDAYQTCSRCDYSTYAEKKALGHSLVNHAAQAPTCTEIGWDAYQTCSRCDYSTFTVKKALGHNLINHAAQAPTCTEIGWNAYITCSRCDYSSYSEKKALGHSQVSHAAQAPTCTEIGWNAYVTCSRCDYSSYSEKKALGHSLVSHAAQAPTCTEPGWNAYITCKRCDYSSYQELPALEHLYGEWISNADGTDTASCQRGCGSQKTVVRTKLAPILPTEDAAAAEITLSPVSGEVSDGTQLTLVETAAAEALTETLPAGKLVLRMGTLESGETLLSVAFELGGALTRPTGQVRLTLPADLLEGYSLILIDGDGTETPIVLDVQEDEASFVLDFTDSQTPVALLRLMPEV